jgi:hypothetical protein
MTVLHPSRHILDVAERIAEGGVALAVALLCVITLATLVYAWFIA